MGLFEILSEEHVTVVLPLVMPYVPLSDSFVSRPCLVWKVYVLTRVSVDIR